MLFYIYILLILLNIISFIFYSYDKYKATQSNKKEVTRVSEKTLLISSLIGGTIGSILAMVIFRHKIKKLSFMLKFIVVVVLQLTFLYLLIMNEIL